MFIKCWRVHSHEVLFASKCVLNSSLRSLYSSQSKIVCYNREKETEEEESLRNMNVL
jgi:hypothetical protein